MKLILTLALFLDFTTSFSQWTKVKQLPSSDIFTLYHKDSTLYAGGKKVIYFSRDKGQTWDSTTAIPQLSFLSNIIVYKNELYAAAPRAGVFKSADGGTTWQNISAGIFPEVADFCEFRGDLYAATLGNSVYKLNPVNGNSWLFFSSGLSNLSANLPSIASNSNAIIAGTLGNGIYGHLPANSTTWEERLLAGRLDPNEGAYDIVTAHDTLFYSGRTGKFYMSTDNGLNWNFIGNRLVSAATTLVNTKQALLASRHIFESGSFKILFYYIKKDALQNPFINFSIVSNHFTYKIDVLGDRLWDASNKGLFYMSLSDLPEISADDNPENILLPPRFTLFIANCEAGKVLITWKTAQEQNSSHFDIERSIEGANWTVIGSLPAVANSSIESSYSFTDNNPGQRGFYRIAEYGPDGQVHHTGILQSSCNVTDVFKLWPNPVLNMAFIKIVSANNSQAIIKIVDSKGASVKIQRTTILQGSNQLSIGMQSMAKGVYSLSVYWNNGQSKKTIQILKQ
ncbi:MAG TPA: T9SS type A sorting domain-containing protein [Chitinophagaceae bacterium]